MEFDRYLLAQLMRTTLSVAVTLIGIVWLFQTIRILEIVVNRGAPITDFFVMSVTVVPLVNNCAADQRICGCDMGLPTRLG